MIKKPIFLIHFRKGVEQLIIILLFLSISGCNKNAPTESTSSYAPMFMDDWEVSTPEAQGLDPQMIQYLYRDAEAIDHLYSILLIRNGYPVAESIQCISKNIKSE